MQNQIIQKMKAARKAAKITQVALASLMEISESRLQKIESGRHDLQLTTVQRYLKECGCELIVQKGGQNV